MHKLLLVLLCSSISVSAQDTTKLKLLFVGDIMQHDSNIAAAYHATTKKYDYSECFQFAAPILRSADLTIGNLELTLAGSPYKGYPQFSAPDALAVALKDTGFDVLVTANNHSADRGRKGVERTIRVLDSLQIQHTGTFTDSTSREATYPLVIQSRGFRLSLLNYTYGTNGLPIPRPNKINLIDTALMALDLKKASDQKTDAIIVFLHWGNEYQSLPNAFQKQLADWCLARGATLVIGAHPHVLQPMEWRQDKNQFIAYSLGNFVSGQRPRYRDGGALLWIELQKIKADSLTVTTINDADYELEWMYKTQQENKFYMLPMRYFENDTTFIQEKASREARDLFKTDSRLLLGKHNIHVTERLISNDSAYYKIEFIASDEVDINHSVLQFYGISKDEQQASKYWVGLFDDPEIAEQARRELTEKLNNYTFQIRKFVAR